MGKVSKLILLLLTIGLFAPLASAQRPRVRYFYGGTPFYRSYYRPFYRPYYWGWPAPMTVYDPVAARQEQVLDNLKDLNKAGSRLMGALESEQSLKEARDQADKVAKYAHELRKNLNNGDADKVAAGPLVDQDVRDTAANIEALINQINNTDINVSGVVNISQLQTTLNRLAEIESQARGLKIALGGHD